MTLLTRPILLATRNAGKLRELRPLLTAHGLVCRTLDEVGLTERAEEAGIEQWDTFEANALAKARYYSALVGELGESGSAADVAYAVLAEDSGLCVDALNGAPGVHSKRWGGEAGTDVSNNERLLMALSAVTDRRAAYVCCAVLVTPEAVYTAHGATTGRILEAPSGSAGFGYDPLFWSDDLQAGFGEVSAAAKAGVSHRSRAVEQVVRQLLVNFRQTS